MNRSRLICPVTNGILLELQICMKMTTISINIAIKLWRQIYTVNTMLKKNDTSFLSFFPPFSSSP